MGKIKNVNLVAILAIVLVAFMTVGYAYVNENITSARASVQKSWNVGLNTEEYTSSGDGIDSTGPVISKNNIKFQVSFVNPGEYKTYTFEVLNTGDINAILDNIKIVSDSNNSKDLSFNYTIYKGENIITSNAVPALDEQYNHLYRTYGTNTIEVTIMYNSYEGQEVPESVIGNYRLDLTYTQAE